MPFRFLFPALFLVCHLPVWGGVLSFSVDGAAAHALRHNPPLAAARLRIEEAQGRFQQSGRLSNPQLELEFSRNTKSSENELGIVLMQRFPLTARLRHEKAVSRAELAAAGEEVKDAGRKLAAEVRTAALKLLALDAQRALRVRQVANSRELADFLLKRVEVGEASSFEALQVDLETRQLELENLQLTAEESVLVAGLRPLLGLGGESEIRISGALASPEPPPPARDVAKRPDVEAARYRAEAAAAALLQQRASRWEDIGLGASYSRARTMDEPEPVETEQMVGLRVSIPLPLWNNNAGRIREARATAMRVAKEADATKLNAGAEATGARAQMEAVAKLIAGVDATLLPKAARIEELLRTNFSGGLVSLTDVLRARARRLELQRLRIDALRDYQLARNRYRAATRE
ncbi:MAG: TolC family protein [Verrucomicrobiota bacterium]